MKICSKKGCSLIGVMQASATTIYCMKHYRFYRMRVFAQTRNKYVPSHEELEKLLPQTMICSTCYKRMIWNSKLGCRNDVISLQHNNNGTIMLICTSCNCGHGHSKLGDEYFNIPKDHKYCPDCEKTLLINKFNYNKTRKDKHQNICKKCHSIRKKNEKEN